MDEVTDWSAQWAMYAPDRMAFRDGDTGDSLTFTALDAGGSQLALALLGEWGLTPGDRIAILAENCLAYPLLFAAAQKAGFILVPINYRLSPPEVAFILGDADPAMVIVEPCFDALLSTTVLPERVHRLPLADVYAISQSVHPRQDRPVIAPDDPIFILYTSGTTGFPKGALYTHKMLFWNSVNTALSLVVNTESRTVNVMPPFHTGGWNVLLTPFLHRGGYTCLLRKFDAGRLLKVVEAEKATVLMAVPTMLRMMADDPAFATADFDALRYVIVGGEPLSPELIKRWHDRGVPIRQGFGMTEVGPNLFSLHQDDADRKRGSIGRPNFYVQTKIVDAEGRTCPANQAGELWLRGPMTTPGYWRNPEATKKAFAGEWFRTGDIVRRDEDGYFFVAGRLKEMYISGGENVYPAEVERWLEAHPAIREAAVVGVADERWGEVGYAYWVPESEVAEVGEDQLVAHCRRGLARFKVPKYFTKVEELPKNATGKIDKVTLQEQAKESVSQ
ncbi:class I adenylate-forming enzyme family protein [Lewinella sp. W8]|uniref:class I adenylate-forming enzyme family protein n=1 Tax=Lewinella sp. W8 TaxID=2528208 RepID=UPI00106752EE|nr:long-chain fatty acid--CoA ligase [Lewinella sp. W8]MTB53431.1 AMP-binding protein [Lewinella sp. W8]